MTEKKIAEIIGTSLDENSKIAAALHEIYPATAQKTPSYLHDNFERLRKYLEEPNTYFYRIDADDFCKLLWDLRVKKGFDDSWQKLFLENASLSEDKAQILLCASLLLGQPNCYNKILEQTNAELQIEKFQQFIKSIYYIEFDNYEKFVRTLNELAGENPALAAIKPTLIEEFNERTVLVNVDFNKINLLKEYAAQPEKADPRSLDELLSELYHHFGYLDVDMHTLDPLSDFLYRKNQNDVIAKLIENPDLAQLIGQLVMNTKLHPFIRIGFADLLEKYENLPDQTKIITKVFVNQMQAMNEQTSLILQTMQQQINALSAGVQDLKRIRQSNSQSEVQEASNAKRPTPGFF